MEKKTYERPMTEMIRLQSCGQLLSASPIPTGEGGQPAGSREDNADWED